MFVGGYTTLQKTLHSVLVAGESVKENWCKIFVIYLFFFFIYPID